MNELLARFNALSCLDAEQELLSCCGSHAWAASLARQRPFSSEDALMEAAELLWFKLPEADWLEAFACHPRIGEKKPPDTAYLSHSSAEQAAAQQTLASVAGALAEGNRLYEQRFGFRYIVFASGRSAPELLQVLERRLLQPRAEELQEAARQQHRITHLRMSKWLQAGPQNSAEENQS